MRHPVVRFGAGIVTAMLAGVAAALVVYQASVQPGAAIVKAVFERGPLVTPPPGFAQLARSVTKRTIMLPAAGAPPSRS